MVMKNKTKRRLIKTFRILIVLFFTGAGYLIYLYLSNPVFNKMANRFIFPEE